MVEQGIKYLEIGVTSFMHCSFYACRYAEMGAFHRGSKRAGSEYSYYGIKGVPRVSSKYIVYGCILFIVLGATVHYIIFK